MPQENGFCYASSYPVVVAEKIEGAVVVPEVPGYPDSKMEIIAPCNIRDSLGVTDGDLVKVGIGVEKVRYSLLKERHIKCCLEKNVKSSLTTGFKKYYLVNQSLPEMAFEDVDTSSSVAVMLREAGVWALDVAGAGGTSWAKIERYIKDEDDPSHSVGDSFDSWGIPTVDSLISILEVIKDMPIITSGGIGNGVEMAKAIALGAGYVGMALPLLAPAMESHEAVKEKIQSLIDEFRTAMFC